MLWDAGKAMIFFLHKLRITVAVRAAAGSRTPDRDLPTTGTEPLELTLARMRDGIVWRYGLSTCRGRRPVSSATICAGTGTSDESWCLLLYKFGKTRGLLDVNS